MGVQVRGAVRAFDGVAERGRREQPAVVQRRNSNVVGRTATRPTAGSTPSLRRIRVQFGASWIPAPTSERVTGLLVDADVPPRLQERDRRRQAADPATDDRRRGKAGSSRHPPQDSCVKSVMRSFYRRPGHRQIRSRHRDNRQRPCPIGSFAVTDLSGIVKAYDVRGVVPDQLDEDGRARHRRGASPACSCRTRRARGRHRPRHARRLARPRGRVRRGRHRPGPRRRRGIGLASTDHAVLRLRLAATCRARCSPPATTRPSTTASRCAGPGAAPIGQDTGLADDPRPRAERDGVPAARRAGRHGHPARPARRLRRLPARPGRPLRHPAAARSSSTRATAWAATPCPPCSPACRCDVVPLYFELDGTFPNHEANPLDPANLVDLQARGRRRAAPTSAWPSTATPTAASSSTSAASRSARARSPRWSPSASWPRRPAATIIHNLITSRAVPEIVARARRRAGAHPRRALVHQGRDGRAPTRCSAASTRRTTTSATSGAPTPACSPRCTCWPRSASRTAPLSELIADYDRYVASGEINSTVDDQAGGRRPPCGPRSPTRRRVRRAGRADRRPARRVAGSTCARRNTEPLLRLNVEAADEPRWPRCATRCSRSFGREGRRRRPRPGRVSGTSPTKEAPWPCSSTRS